MADVDVLRATTMVVVLGNSNHALVVFKHRSLRVECEVELQKQAFDPHDSYTQSESVTYSASTVLK